MTRLELESEIALLEHEKRRIGYHLHKLKNKLYNQKCRENRKAVERHGFTLNDVLSGKVELKNLDDAIWFDRASFLNPRPDMSFTFQDSTGKITTKVVSEIRECIKSNQIVFGKQFVELRFIMRLHYPFDYWGLRDTFGIKREQFNPPNNERAE